MKIFSENLDDLDNTETVEFVITLAKVKDLDSFYSDIENDGGPEFIPDRAVKPYMRRPTSVNTHYLLTAREAAMLQQDPRVVAVLPADLIRSSMKYNAFTQTATFSKTSVELSDGNPPRWPIGTVMNSNWKNWALLRCTEGAQRTNWGDNGTATQTATVTVGPTGKNVDIVMVDGMSGVPNHPEYAKNADGTGGTRCMLYDWNLLTSIVAGIDDDAAPLLKGPYPYYKATVLGNANHGSHTTSTVAGNTQGWASDANIYQIDPLGGTIDRLIYWDYIRAFHKNKPINPETGRRNPTVVNASIGTSFPFPYYPDQGGSGYVLQGTWRGTTVGNYSRNYGLTAVQLDSIGMHNDGSSEGPAAISGVPLYWDSDAADMAQAVADGVIIVAAAGNESFYIANPGDVDYNNNFVARYGGTPYLWNQHRGCAPGSVPGVVCVGAVGADKLDSIAWYSNRGPRVDVFAPGTWITGALSEYTGAWRGSSSASDPRNSAYYIGRLIGTSMASPQVAGMLACIAELYPNMTPADAMTYVKNYAKLSQMPDTGGTAPGWTSDTKSLQGATNRYMFMPKERPVIGIPYPKKNVWIRPISGRTYPRVRRRMRG